MCLSESWWSFVSDAVLNGQHNKIRTYSAVFGQFFFLNCTKSFRHQAVSVVRTSTCPIYQRGKQSCAVL